jgi:hypothetical protein
LVNRPAQRNFDRSDERVSRAVDECVAAWRLEHVRVDLSSAQEELELMARKILADDEDEAEETKQLTGPKTS